MAPLTREQRSQARDIAVHAALIGLRHAPVIHYTQLSERWQGIADTRYAARGQYPNYADCSAFVTWCMWNALAVRFSRVDHVNGARWKAGYTGTLIGHGKAIRRSSEIMRADAVIYGPSRNNTEHTAIIVGRKNGVPMVVSHGSEGGPYYLPWNYRSDILSVRRYIHRGI